MVLAHVAIAALTGCAPLELRQPVTVVRTSTPGVAYVLIQPVTQKERDEPDPQLQETDRNSDYILLCDARRGDGMRCSLTLEVSHSRFSEHRPIAKSGASFSFGTAVESATEVRSAGAAEATAQPGAAPAPGAGR